MTLNADLTDSPTLYPFALDLQADRVQFLSMTQADYAAASFLDKRMLLPDTLSTWVPWADVSEAATGLPLHCHFIFHISHVGSTLLSRLLGCHPAFFSLREPFILRQLANIQLTLDQPECGWSRAEFEERLGLFLGLWSRTFLSQQTAVIKATSFAGEMAEHLMERVPHSRAIFMYIAPLTFLKALLGGAMSDITGTAEKRLMRLHRRLGKTYWDVQNLSPGECVAMSWLSEIFALHAAGIRFPERVQWMDFDHFLLNSEPTLADSLRHLGVEADDPAAREILAGETMRRYAKAPEHEYNAQVRQQLLHQAEVQHLAEIHKGIEWLRRASGLRAVREVLNALAAHAQPTS